MARRVGRPSIYSAELVDLICKKIRDGNSIHALSKLEGIPSEDTIYGWLHSKPEFAEKYARAREERADRMAQEILEIADDGTNDTLTRADGSEGVDYDNINRSRLRVDTRKWLMARMAPKKYGDKITQEVTGENGNPVQITVRWGVKPDAES